MAILKDAWHAERYFDKVRIWFMPTGWRPADVKEKFPLLEISNPAKQLKYNTILGGQINSRGGVNNCVNGQDCSLYVSPQYGSNKGVKSNKYVPISILRSKCNGRRLAGMRQTCLS